MRTVGVDLAAEADRTAVAWIDWSVHGASVSELVVGADDELIVEALLAADKAGIDCPFGWPDLFVSFVSAHRAGTLEVHEGPGRRWRRDLALRVTDQLVQDSGAGRPLSVSADRIGHTAMRCANLLAQLAQRGHPVDRSGQGSVIEVYPAASLKQWGLPHNGYKGADQLAELGHLVDQFNRAAPWLDLGRYESVCRNRDDAIDAVIAAITVRAAAKGLAHLPGAELADAARTEGWIVVPTGTLNEVGR